jgi:hypothetical protein
MSLEVTRRRGELASGFGLLALGVYGIVEASAMPMGSLALPGPGVFSLVLSILLCIATLGVLAEPLLHARDSEARIRLFHGPVLLAFAALCGVALLLERAGFLLTMTLFLLVLYKAFSTLGWLRAAAAAVVSALVVHAFFVHVIGGGLVASMLIGNAMLVVLNLPMVGLFVNLLRVPYAYLAPMVLVVSVVGVYSVNASPVEIALVAIFGLIGYVLRKFDFDVAPLLLAVVLGDRMETSFRRALTISGGDYAIFVSGTIAQVLAAALVLVIALQLLAWRLGVRRRDLKMVEN